jgi:2,3-bisphosphoglycerate-independent phosphoglycerate mutase
MTMKYVILVGDGMGDYPVAELGGRTPLQAAEAPAMRAIAAAGQVYRLRTVPPGLPPGSDVCNMGLLGYNAKENYTGRAPIEAAGAGIPLTPGDVAFRCNLVTVREDRMIDYSAGHITTEEGDAIIRDLAAELNSDQLTFHPGISYRHLLVWRNGPDGLTSQPPHEIADQLILPHLPTGERDAEVRDLMARSRQLLAQHPVNMARQAAGKEMATQIWLWGQGKALTLPGFQDLYGLTGGVITAVDLVRGLGRLAGLETPHVPGATGFVDTNYQGKVEAGKKILASHPFLYLHIEAPDECGHMGDAPLKTKAISDFDAQVVAPIWSHLEEQGEPYRLIVAMDHRTPVSLRGHTEDPVPLAVLDGPVGADARTRQAPFDESALDEAPEEWSYELMRRLLK